MLASCVADIAPLPKGWLHVAPPTKDSTTMTRTDSEIDYLVSIKKGETLIMSPIRFRKFKAQSPSLLEKTILYWQKVAPRRKPNRNLPSMDNLVMLEIKLLVLWLMRVKP